MQYLSIDVVAGALAGGVMATIILNVNPGWAWWVVLGLSVWLIYSADHLLDAFKASHESLSKRHEFHLLLFKPLIFTVLIVGITTLFIALTYLPLPIIYFGLVLGFTVLLYLMIIFFAPGLKIKFFPKEFIISLIYVVGIWGGPTVMAGSFPGWIVILVAFLYWNVALMDLLMLSYYEIVEDSRSKYISFAVTFGKEKTKLLFNLRSSLSNLGGVALLFFNTDKTIDVAIIILMAMSILLTLIFYYNSVYGRNYSYRYLGDLVFSLPFLMLVF
jgi:uncharacterized membrane protein